MINKSKRFDCVKMKNTIQAQVYSETKGMNFNELKAYFTEHLCENSFWEKINKIPGVRESH